MVHDDRTIRLAALCRSVRTLGPGARNAIWLQGCPFNCLGCIAPEFRTFSGGEVWSLDSLANWHLVSPNEGLTISGGEPFHQAASLADLLKRVRSATPSIILYSGYTLAQLERSAAGCPATRAALDHCDVLIDGLYDHARNDSTGLRGSSNQSVHFLTTRHAEDRVTFEEAPRQIEVHAQADGILQAGLPSIKEWRTAPLPRISPPGEQHD